MNDGTAFITMVSNVGFAIAVATYLLLKTNTTLQEIIKTICSLKKSIQVLSEKIESLRK